MHNAVQGRSINLFYTASLFIAVVMGIDLATNILAVDEQTRMVYSDIAAPIVDLLACIVLFIAAKQSASHSRRLGIAWGLIASSVLVFAIADAIWAILELGLSEPPFPSLADLFYLIYYPLLLAGVLLLPEEPTTREEKIKKVLDAGVVMVAAFLVFWNFLIGPVVASNADYPLLEQAILLAYPVGDLVLLWALLRIIYRSSEQHEENEVPAFLLAASLVMMIIADCVYTYQALLDTYSSGGILDVCWRASILMMGLAGISQVSAIRSWRSTGKFPLPLESMVSKVKSTTPYLAYVWLIAAYILLIQSRNMRLSMSFVSLSIAVGGIICLILLRQIITLLENYKLNLQLQQTMQTLQGQTSELEKTNEELQNEITERKAIERQLTHDSLHDAMTGLPNRVLFLDRLGQAIEYCKRRTEYTFAILFVDIDQFKVINDSLGHLTGDQLLISAGRRMKDSLRGSDTVARLGGDEFAILLEITGEKDSAAAIAEKLQQSLKLPFKLDGHELYVTASIGIVTNVTGYIHPEEVLRDADIAMYKAKSSGKARFEIFDIKMRSHAFSRLEMEQDLRSALENREFRLYYQPIIAMASNQLVSFEALIRWIHPTRGLLLPGEFLPIAEESGLILPIEKWVLHEACAQLKQWHQNYPSLQNVSVNVNISNRQFAQSNFVDGVVKALHATDLKPEYLKLEITENILISNYAAANEVFTKLRNLGVQLEIDDFGSGYSALGYLQHFPISAIKIDKSFIDEIGKSRRGVELIRAIVTMARELGMEAIAEGIETGEQLDELKNLSCSFGQGFLLSKPLDKESAEKILELSCSFGQGFLLSKPLDKESAEKILESYESEPAE
jgi:diguanylate cyclase (GGDEF)-like protein